MHQVGEVQRGLTVIARLEFRQRRADTQFDRYRIRLTILGDLPALTGLL